MINAEIHRRGKEVKKVLNRLLPDADIALTFHNPFQLLVATILSAQCTDTLVNKVTPRLFQKYKTPASFAKADVSKLAKDIYPVTFYKNKARAIKATAGIIDRQYGGKVPKEKDKLVKLPGVASKTANVVLAHAYKIASGFIVDTHVKRVSKRLGLTKNTDPKKIEDDLMQVFDKKDWIKTADQLIWFGRRYCTARKDKCAGLGIKLKHFSK